MFLSKETHLAWLAAALGGQRNRIIDLIRRMTSLGSPGGMNPRIFGKFLRLLDQVASARDREIGILDRIEAIEEQHRFCRKNHMLEHIQSDPRKNPEPDGQDEAETEQPNNSLLLFLVVWAAFFHHAINQKKQGLTVD
jgi:hypothetical protein